MMSYRYNTYSEIPPKIIKYFKDVVGVNILDLTIVEVNQNLASAEEYYQRYDQRFDDFLEE